MRLLWVTNTVFPALSRELGLPEPVIGGWMYGLAQRIASTPGIELAVATAQPGGSFISKDIGPIRYYRVPVRAAQSYDSGSEQLWRRICNEVAPDIVHLHGTERPHGVACMRARTDLPYIVSIQGLTGINARYHYGGLGISELLRAITIRDLIYRDSVFHSKRQRVRAGAHECECIRRASVVVGRTAWDRTHVTNIHPGTTYAACNESLRDGFYASRKWNLDECARNLIFVSQAHTPMKGFHKLLCAVALLKDEFPSIKVRAAGRNIIDEATIWHRIGRSGYGAYIRRLIKALGIENHVSYTGRLTEGDMIDEYRAAHAFVCPSAIENSPNSVGEAQILGVPVVAAYAGGIPDMIADGKTGLLYRYEEVEMLAAHLKSIFSCDDVAKSLSSSGSNAATLRHDREAVANRILDIYHGLC